MEESVRKRVRQVLLALDSATQGESRRRPLRGPMTVRDMLDNAAWQGQNIVQDGWRRADAIIRDAERQATKRAAEAQEQLRDATDRAAQALSDLSGIIDVARQKLDDYRHRLLAEVEERCQAIGHDLDILLADTSVSVSLLVSRMREETGIPNP